MRRVPASQLSLDASRGLASRALNYRTALVAYQTMENDRAFRHFCDDEIGGKASMLANPCLCTQQAAERPR